MASEESVSLRDRYYAENAREYDNRHSSERGAHDSALRVVSSLLPMLECGSLLDVGAGTGRAARYLNTQWPSLSVRGVEPIEELIEQAEARGVPAGSIVRGSGERLPFNDGEFDVVTSFGILHHVPEPSLIIAEMLRVAKKAVFISDSNRFGQGRPVARAAKLALAATGLWKAFDLVRTRGKRYMVSEGDGVYYSYSVFDSMPQLRRDSKRLMVVEVEPARSSMGLWSTSLLNASTVLVGAFKSDFGA